MIITPGECYVPADQDLTTDRDVTLDITSGSELDEVSQGYSPVRRPEPNAHGTAHEFSVDYPWVQEIKFQNGTEPVADGPAFGVDVVHTIILVHATDRARSTDHTVASPPNLS
jgi:hypothetical protein